MAMKKFGKVKNMKSGKMNPMETMSGTTQKSDAPAPNKADKSLASLMKGHVFPSYGKKATRATGANKDRRTK